MTYDVLDVARYIINYGSKHECNISNLRLQKILYFVQVTFYMIKGEPCFNEDIEAWDFGPVVPEVYHEYKRYGRNEIPHIGEYIDFSKGVWEATEMVYNEDIIDERDRDLINEVIDSARQYSTNELVEITHDQSPWKDAYIRGWNNTISKESIKEYFIEG